MSNEPLIFKLDDVEYRMNLGNAIKSWAALKKAGKLFKGIGAADVLEDDKKTINKGKMMMTILDVVLDNAGSDEFNAIEAIVFNNTIINKDDEKPFKLSDKKETHFNEYRSHILPVLKQGVVFQFADFFKGNGLLETAGLATPNS